jgi:8-oxo-dGTP pyrophosphatase MutT (NUDIX family)
MPTPAPARPAASLILLRERDGLEVLMGRRDAATAAFPGAVVFPGGKIEPQDREAAAIDGPSAGDPSAAARRAALRETFEETGLFLTADGKAPPAGVDRPAERLAVEEGRRRFAELEERWAVRAGTARLIAFAHWVTPEDQPYRFDTRFFLAEASAYEAGAELLCAEFEWLSWLRPREVLEGDPSRLARPTRRCLQLLAQSRTPAEAAAEARQRGEVEGGAVEGGAVRASAGPQG